MNMIVYEKLLKIQTEISAPKDKYNKFGNYNYRNLESILEGVKPLLKKYNCVLLINNELEEVGGKIFRKSIATLKDVESSTEATVSTYTLEPLEKKGMSPEQCSGSSASYGDKYALNKLFCLDDTKDADATNTHDKQSGGANPAPSQAGMYKVTIPPFAGMLIKDIAQQNLIDFCSKLKAQEKDRELTQAEKTLLIKTREFLTGGKK